MIYLYLLRYDRSFGETNSYNFTSPAKRRNCILLSDSI